LSRESLKEGFGVFGATTQKDSFDGGLYLVKQSEQATVAEKLEIGPHGRRWQVLVSGFLLASWILFLSWIAWAG